MHQKINGYTPLTSNHHIGSIKHHFGPIHAVTSNYQYKPQTKMYIVLFHDSTHLTMILYQGHYTLLAICWRNMLYGMPQSQPYSFGDSRFWARQTQWCHRKGLYGIFLQQILTAITEHIQRHIILSLCDHLKWHFLTWTYTRRWRIWKWEWLPKYSHSSLYRAPRLYHVSKHENLSFDSATPLTSEDPHPAFWDHCPVCCYLMFSSSDGESPVLTRDPCHQYPRPSGSGSLLGRVASPLSVQYTMNDFTSPPSSDIAFQDATTDEEEFPPYH